MARDDLHFRLRIPEALKSQLESAAAENNRSVTAEIVSRLERSFAVVPEWENALENVQSLLERVEYLEKELSRQGDKLDDVAVHVFAR